MRKLIPILCGLVVFCCAFAEDTNQVSGGLVSTNAVQRQSDAEQQAAARQTWHKLIVVGVLALFGATVVAGFALYGAYRKFGVAGAIVVGVIIAFGVVALGGLLLIF